MYSLAFKGSFSAAHQLVGHSGKCALLHGHRWEVTISLRTLALNKQHMVVDFHDLEAVLERYDHSGEIFHGTAESIAGDIWREAMELMEEHQYPVECIVEVEESPGCIVHYQRRVS